MTGDLLFPELKSTKPKKNQKLDFLLLSLSWAYLDIFAR
jgi:hypothetical protein